MYDLIIIGGGPAGAAAGVYAARKRLKSLLITESFGGQSIVSPEIYNWIGTKAITGEALADALRDHVTSAADDVLTIVEGARVEKIETLDVQEPDGARFTVTDSNNTTYAARAILVTTGSVRRKLDVPGAETFDNKGLTYCASCDGPLFADQDVVVIGGGNAGLESAAQLLAYCKSVTLIHRREEFKADPVTVEKVLAHPNMKAIMNAEPVEVLGDTFVTGLVYKDKMTGETATLPVTGIFVEIGAIPATGFLEGIVDLNETKHVIVDPRTQMSSREGIWAAGDVTDGLYHQNNIAAGDAVKALENIYLCLRAK